MSLKAYSVADLQTALSIISLSNDNQSLRLDIAAEIKLRTLPKENVPYTRVDDLLCPSCGAGSLYVCGHTTALVGMTVKVCSRHCGIS